jgi:hypothetical protein
VVVPPTVSRLGGRAGLGGVLDELGALLGVGQQCERGQPDHGHRGVVPGEQQEHADADDVGVGQDRLAGGRGAHEVSEQSGHTGILPDGGDEVRRAV